MPCSCMQAITHAMLVHASNPNLVLKTLLDNSAESLNIDKGITLMVEFLTKPSRDSSMESLSIGLVSTRNHPLGRSCSHRIAASLRELKLNKVSPLRSKTVLKSFLPSRKMVNVPEATAFCNIVNVPDVIVLFDLQSQKPCDVQLCEKKTKPKKTSAFCRAQMCTKCSRRPKPKKTNAFPMQSPNVQIFSCAQKSPGVPRCTLMERSQVPGANVHECRMQFNAAS